MFATIGTHLGDYVNDNAYQFASISRVTLLDIAREYEFDVKHYVDSPYGEWFLFCNIFGPFSIIRADTYQDAWDALLDEGFVGEPEQPEDEADAANGQYGPSGQWYSEATLCDVRTVGRDGYEITVEWSAD